MVVQVISAMAHHGYLELDGGDLLVRFIVQHCALPDTFYVSLFPPRRSVNNLSVLHLDMCPLTFDL